MVTLVLPFSVSAQGWISKGEVHGNFQLDAQTYKADSAIGAPEVEEKMMMNGFLKVTYTNGPLEAGVRYEGYLNPILGFDPRYEGQGFPFRYISFKKDKFEITAGNFYEQFGNGLVLRSYEEWGLGYDNSIDGFRVAFHLHDGVTIKGVYGKQRYFWDKGPGIVRGVDGEIDLNTTFKKLHDKKTRFILGGSFVSKYQANEDIFISPDEKLILPLNVGAWAGRMTIMSGKFVFSGEYANKFNDPSAINDYIYKNGQVMLLNGSYSKKGLGITITGKYLDNMSYKSKRTETSSALDINFLPPLVDQYTYSLAAMYPYATQPNGEGGVFGQVVYTIPKKTKAGGRYGTTIKASYSRTDNIWRQALNDSTPIGESGTLGYDAKLFKLNSDRYYEEINVDIQRKFNKKFKLLLFYLWQFYNIDVIEGHTGESSVYANTIIADMTYKITPTKALRLELQGLFTQQDDGDWAMALLEFTMAPQWFFTVSDMYNYGNPVSEGRQHYYNFAFGFTKGSSRVALSYGRQREGILCVGGVCRNVPAANGLTLTLTSNF